MLDGGDALILRRHGAARGDQGLARGVRHQMKVEIAASQSGLARYPQNGWAVESSG